MVEVTTCSNCIVNFLLSSLLFKNVILHCCFFFIVMKSFPGKARRLGLLCQRRIRQFYNLACIRHGFNGVSRLGRASIIDTACVLVFVCRRVC